MPKSSAARSGASSRIRFVMVEAEIANGDVSQITQAIQNALRGPTTTVQRISAPTVTKTLVTDTEETSENVEIEEAPEDAEATAQTQPRGPRKPAPTPKVIQIDLSSEKSLSSYVDELNPKNHYKRYLVIAAWFHEHRSTDTISVDHVYTCYRALKLPLNIPDFSQPLRDLKKKQFFTTPEQGKYAINHLGLAEVESLRSHGEQ